MPPPKLPEKLGKYPITGIAGKGAMGVVFKGFDPVIKRPVAIKTIRKELLEDGDQLEAASTRFRREAQAAGGLNHPGIVAVYEYGEDGDYAYIAMEWVEGSNLRDYIANGTRFNERDAVSLMSQLLDALQCAHAANVWHRDIKPGNIIVMGDGRIKLADFGIARLEAADSTRTNAIMGTPGFIAPEWYLGGAIDHRADIFAAGVLFYQLLAKVAPFKGSAEAVMHDVCYHDPPPPSSVDPNGGPAQYDAIVARAIAKAPSARFQRAEEFRNAILDAYAHPVSNTISEATIIEHRQRRPEGVAAAPATRSMPEPGGALGRKSGALSMASYDSPPPSGWDVMRLAEVELALARYVGPVGRVLVRRAARQHKEMAGLVEALLPALDAPKDREDFARQLLGNAPRRPAPATATSTALLEAGPAQALGADDGERAVRLLMPHVGPIAKVLVKRAAAAGGSRSDFWRALAASIDAEPARERFLREAGVI